MVNNIGLVYKKTNLIQGTLNVKSKAILSEAHNIENVQRLSRKGVEINSRNGWFLIIYLPSLCMEQWRKIEGSFEYYISNYGRVKRGKHVKFCKKNNSFSNYKEHFIRTNCNNTKRYPRVNITYRDGKTTLKCVHRLVAEAFIPNPLNLPQVNHKDGNKNNAYYSNLEWISSSDNAIHAIRILKVRNYKIGEASNFTVLREKQVIQIPKLLKTMTIAAISRKFGVSANTITEIKKGRSWKHLNLKFD